MLKLQNWNIWNNFKLKLKKTWYSIKSLCVWFSKSSINRPILRRKTTSQRKILTMRKATKFWENAKFIYEWLINAGLSLRIFTIHQLNYSNMLTGIDRYLGIACRKSFREYQIKVDLSEINWCSSTHPGLEGVALKSIMD